MGTLIQTGAVRDAAMAASPQGDRQTLQNEINSSERLGAFLSGVANSVSKGIKDHQDAHAPEVIALGMNDAITGATHDISLLHRKNYAHGLNYQSAVGGTAALDNDMQTRIANFKVGDDPQELLATADELGRTKVSMIAEARLPPKLAAALYEEVLTQRVTHTTNITKRLAKVRIDAEDATHKTQIAKAYNVFTLDGKDVDTDIVVINWQAQANVIRENYMAADPTRTYAEAEKHTDGVFTTALNMRLASLADPKMNPNAVSDLRTLATKGVSAGVITPESFVKLEDTINKIQADQVRENESIFSVNIETDMSNFELSTEGYTHTAHEKIVSKAKDAQLSGLIGVEARDNIIKKSLNTYVSSQKAIKDVLDPMAYTTLEQFEQADGKPAEWIGARVTDALKVSGNNLAKASEILINQGLGGLGGTLEPKLIAKGAELAMRPVAAYLVLSDAEVKKTPFGAEQAQHYQQVMQTYRGLSDAAKAMYLSGVDPSIAVAIGDAAELGISDIQQVRRMLSNSKDVVYNSEKWVSSLKEYKPNVDTAWYSFTDKDSGSWKGGYTPKVLQGHLTESMKHVAESWNKHFVSVLGIVPNAATLDTQLHSQGAFRPAAVGAVTQYTYNANKTYLRERDAYGTTDEWMQDALYERQVWVAKQYGTKPENVIVSTNYEGSNYQFTAYNDKGVQLNTAALDRGISGNAFYPISEVAKEAQRHSKASTKATLAAKEKDAAIQYPKQGGFIRTMIDGNPIAVALRLSADHYKAFKGNRQVTEVVMQQLVNEERFITQPKTQADPNGSPVTTLGLAVNLDAVSSADRKALLSSVGNREKLMALSGKQLNDLIGQVNMNKQLKQLNIPSLESATPYNKRQMAAITLLTDATYHGGKGGVTGNPKKGGVGIMAALTSKNFQEAKSKYVQSTVYRSLGGAGSARNQRRLNLLKEFYGTK